MWSKKNRVWLEFRRDILASDIIDGLFLSDYLRHIDIHHIYSHNIEIIDLQRYKLQKKPSKIKAYVQDRAYMPFIFVVGKN
jgi:hypothetical protein